MALEDPLALLGNRSLAGSPAQLELLAHRLDELAAINGEDWIRRHRDELIRQWESAIGKGWVDPCHSTEA